jgi:hypothetical protein
MQRLSSRNRTVTAIRAIVTRTPAIASCAFIVVSVCLGNHVGAGSAPLGFPLVPALPPHRASSRIYHADTQNPLQYPGGQRRV